MRRRRRNALLIAAGVAFFGGIAIGAGSDGADTHATTKAGKGGGSEPAEDFARYVGDVPILMYHVIAAPPSDAPYPELFVPPDELHDQLAWLKQHGYRGVTLDRMYRAWHKGVPMPSHPIIVSFDDGVLSQFTEALPAMKRIGWPAILNLKLSSMDEGELDEAMVSQMIDAGWEVDSHTISHIDVTTLDSDALHHEVYDSRKQLQRMFKIPVNFFCYPAGKFNRAAIEEVRKSGYLGATTTEFGLAAPKPAYKMRRIRIEGSDGVEGMAKKLHDAEAQAKT